jgi:hypothetical protein
MTTPTKTTSRRGFLFSAGAGIGSVGLLAQTAAHGVAAERPAPDTSPTSTNRIPLIHTTDLYNPPQDPDDHVDLATVYALPEFDLRAIVLDPSRKFLGQLDPGFVPVSQMNYLTGRGVPVAAGPIDSLRSATDTAKDRPRCEQAGIELLLDALSRCEQPAFVSVVGSTRAIAIAWNREPELLRRKVRGVILNAGSTTAKAGVEWNVALDRHAWVALWRSGLPILWYPCTGEHGSTAMDPHNSFWSVSHRQLFDGLAQPIRAYFDYALSHPNRGDVIRALSTMGTSESWQKVLAGRRNMWSTASLVLAAGRVLAQTKEGWRFVAKKQAAGLKQTLLELLPVKCEVSDAGVVTWASASEPCTVRIFHRTPDEEHVRAMAEATNALLRQLP